MQKNGQNCVTHCTAIPQLDATTRWVSSDRYTIGLWWFESCIIGYEAILMQLSSSRLSVLFFGPMVGGILWQPCYCQCGSFPTVRSPWVLLSHCWTDYRIAMTLLCQYFNSFSLIVHQIAQSLRFTAQKACHERVRKPHHSHTKTTTPLHSSHEHHKYRPADFRWSRPGLHCHRWKWSTTRVVLGNSPQKASRNSCDYNTPGCILTLWTSWPRSSPTLGMGLPRIIKATGQGTNKILKSQSLGKLLSIRQVVSRRCIELPEESPPNGSASPELLQVFPKWLHNIYINITNTSKPLSWNHSIRIKGNGNTFTSIGKYTVTQVMSMKISLHSLFPPSRRGTHYRENWQFNDTKFNHTRETSPLFR